jgi:hypothetical protein
MNATKTDRRPTCADCGGRNVESTAWIEYREDGTAAIVAGEGPFEGAMGNWCRDCMEHTELNYPSDHRSNQPAQAAVNCRTPGPWAVQGQWATDRGTAECIEAEGRGIVGAWLPASEEFRHEDARLIAAAPELLAALKEAESAIRWAAQEAAGRVKSEIVGGWLYHAEQAREAIAKAEGRG